MQDLLELDKREMKETVLEPHRARGMYSHVPQYALVLALRLTVNCVTGARLDRNTIWPRPRPQPDICLIMKHMIYAIW